MELSRINCLLCGSICVSFLFGNSPVCEKCLEHHINTPHIEINFPISQNTEIVSINAGGTTSIRISTSMSASLPDDTIIKFI